MNITRSKPQTVERSKDLEQAVSNKIYVCTSLYSSFKSSNGGQEPIYVDLLGYIFILEEDSSLATDHFSVSGVTRSQLKISTTMDHPTLDLFKFGANDNCLIGSCSIKVRCPRLKQVKEVKEKDLADAIKAKYNKHAFKNRQEVFFNYEVVLC